MKSQKFNSSFIHKLISTIDQPRYKCIFEILFFSAIVGIAFYLFGPNLDANWSYRDDHEIMYLSPVNQRVDFRDIIPVLFTKTEINPDSTWPRYRPVFYIFRLLEARIWMFKGAPGWYVDRIIMFLLFIGSMYLTFRKINGRIIGGLLALYLTTSTFLSDIFSRLSPVESYSIFGFSIFLVGILVFIQKRESIFAWLFMMLGVIISVGSKENMGIFVLPFIFIFGYFLSTKPQNKIFPWITLLITMAFTIWTYANIYIRVRNLGSDMYENPIDFSERLNILFSYITNNLGIVIFLGILLLIGLSGMLIKRNFSFKSAFTGLFWGSSFMLALIFSQVFFYVDVIFGRYNFPYALYIPFTISLVVYFIQQLSLTKKRIPLYNIITVIAAIGLIFFIKPVHWVEIRDYSNENVNQTHYFEMKRNSIKKYLTENPDAVLILYGNTPGSDYEMNISYSRFIKFGGIENSIYILRDLPDDYESTSPDLMVTMEKRLLGFSENGSEMYGISPLSEFTENPRKCLLVNMKVDHEAPIHCDEVMDGNLALNFSGLYGVSAE